MWDLTVRSVKFIWTVESHIESFTLHAQIELIVVNPYPAWLSMHEISVCHDKI